MLAAGVMASGVSAQKATFKYFSYEGNDTRFEKSYDKTSE